jgi:predicted RNA binding protein YcfA (HicA-like mRNA interferase family)
MIKYREFISQLEQRGCKLHRTSGKHIIYRHHNLNRNIVITKAKTVSPGLYNECMKLLANV